MSIVLKDIKWFIDQNKLEELKTYYNQVILSEGVSDNLPDLYQKVYLHACLKKRRAIAEWLQTLFTKFDPITKIAYRQMFPYGRYLLAR
jgi:hypothetical protein